MPLHNAQLVLHLKPFMEQEPLMFVLEQFSLTAVGVNMGLSLENFDFGFQYAVPMSSPGKTNPLKVFEMYIVFDFSRFRRNNKGIYKRLQTDNYY